MLYRRRVNADPTLSLRYWGAYDPRVPASHRALLRACAPALKSAMRVGFKLDSERARAKRRAIIDAETIEANLKEA